MTGDGGERRGHGPLNLGATRPDMINAGPLDPGAPLDPLARPLLARPPRAGAARRRVRGHRRALPAGLADPKEVYERASIFDGWVDAINATDGSGANCHMSSVGVCALLTRVGYAPVMQISCRDKNRIAIQGDVLGAAAMGVGNVLCLTGDGTQCGDHPEAKPVFDLDSIALIETIKIMRDERRLLSGRPLSHPPELFIGAAENPFAPPYEFRPLRLAKKIAAGAQFVQTQYCYDLPLLERFMSRVRDLGLHERCFILVGRRAARLGKGRALDPRARAGRAHSRRRDRAHRAGAQAARGGQADLHRADRADPRDPGRVRHPPDGVSPGGGRGRDHRALGRPARPPAAQRDRPLGGVPAAARRRRGVELVVEIQPEPDPQRWCALATRSGSA